MVLEKELRIIVGSNDLILLLCKKRSNFDRELERDGQLARMCEKSQIVSSTWRVQKGESFKSR